MEKIKGHKDFVQHGKSKAFQRHKLLYLNLCPQKAHTKKAKIPKTALQTPKSPAINSAQPEQAEYQVTEGRKP